MRALLPLTLWWTAFKPLQIAFPWPWVGPQTRPVILASLLLKPQRCSPNEAIEVAERSLDVMFRRPTPNLDGNPNFVLTELEKKIDREENLLLVDGIIPPPISKNEKKNKSIKSIFSKMLIGSN
jgi:hypothetical protein